MAPNIRAANQPVSPGQAGRPVRDGSRPRDPSRTSHLPRFGVCDRALAAADFSAFDDFGLLSTFDAADAAFEPVCFVFFAITITSSPGPSSGHSSGRPDKHVPPPTAFLEVVTEFPRHQRVHVRRDVTAPATAGAVARRI